MSDKFTTAPYMARAKEILNQMTITEKIGQLVMTGSMKRLREEDLRDGKIGSLMNIPSVEVANHMQRVVMEGSRLKIPLFIAFDVVHGDRTLFPTPLSGASSWDMKKIEHSEMLAAREAYHEGFNLIFSPMIDICRDPRWGRIAEGAGEDKCLGSAVAAARVRGFQSINPDTGKPYAAACFKHYCGYGLSEAGRDYESCDISERTLHSEYLPVYKAAVNAGSMTCMSSFNTLNGIPVTGSHYYLTELLRDKWGFEGAVVSDWESVYELYMHRVTASDKESARRALLAGVDVDMHSDVYRENLEALALEDEEILSAIDRSVLRVLCVKIALGMFENPYRDEDDKKYYYLPDALAAARDLAASSMVLLKNDKKTLPLDRRKKWLLTGALADARHENLGIWGGRGSDDTVVTIRDALAASGVNIEYIRGCDAEAADRKEYKEGAKLASSCDGIIFVCGEPCQWAGEGGGRADITLNAAQIDYLKLLKSTGKPIVSVVLTARPLVLSDVDELSDAVLLAWQGGIQAGNAVFDVLFGDCCPSGKLPVTFPRMTGQIPLYYANFSGGRPRWCNRSRYRDCDTSPLYPFGYGLSYADISYADIKLESDHIASDGELCASVRVTNESDITAETVVQVYFRDMVSTLATPEKLMCAFDKIPLGAGESRIVKFTIPASKFGFMTEKLEWTIEPGEFRLYIGTDSTTEDYATFFID